MGELAGSGVGAEAADAAEPADVAEAEWVVAVAGFAAAPAGAATVPTAAVTTAATAANLAKDDMLMGLLVCAWAVRKRTRAGRPGPADPVSTEGMP